MKTHTVQPLEFQVDHTRGLFARGKHTQLDGDIKKLNANQ